jgi:aryl-alcohol dehydrogenase-like predicted oxidoreductase
MSSALHLVRPGYGSMQLPGPGVWGEARDHDEAIRVLRRAVELGVTFIDTADSYGPEASELHPWFPMATGRLAKPGGALQRIAGELSVTPAQLALAWLLSSR